MNPKKIVYLIGAGATQAEADFRGGKKINLLMKKTKSHGDGISNRILKRASTKRMLGIKLDEEDEIDIEKLISLLAASGIEKYRQQAEELRKIYFEEILDSLVRAEILDEPTLAMGLLTMHRNQKLKRVEILTGIISLNHDNLFQIASSKIFKDKINLGFKYKSEIFKDGQGKTPPIIMLYGSFNWKCGLPIEVVNLEPDMDYSGDILWIPPSILKEAKDYPYNKLLGIAYELLSNKCDILRIIGCSLSQNDWNILALLFNAQYNQHMYKGECFKIELIMAEDYGEKIKKDCPYLHNLIPIGYLSDGDFSIYKEFVYRKDKGPVSAAGSELDNPFKYWLCEKIKCHRGRREFDINKGSGIIKVIMRG
jgi:hypothetical protein